MRTLLTLLLCPISTSVALSPDLIAVSFGPTYITAAQFAANQAPIPVAQISGRETYQAYIADTLENEGKRIQRFGEWYIRDGVSTVPAPPETHNLQQAQSIFVAAILDIKDAASKAVRHPVEIVTVSRPRHFNESSREAVIKAAMEIESSMKQPKQVIDSINAARLAYGLDSCDGLGLDAKTCDMEEDLHLIVFLEYNRRYLELSLAEVTEQTCVIKGQIRLPELGAVALGITSTDKKGWLSFLLDAPMKKSSPPTVSSKEAHYQRIQDAVCAFMADKNITPEHHLDWTSIRAVVISGDAPHSTFGDLMIWITAVLGEHKHKIPKTIDPLYAGAIEAAQRGRHQMLTPGFLDDIVSTNFVPHDELRVWGDFGHFR